MAATARGFASVRSELQQNENLAKPLDYSGLVNEVRANFHTRKSYSYEYRMKELGNLRRAFIERQDDILKAVHSDLRKHAVEAIQGEFILVITEIDYAMKNLKEWMAPVNAHTPIHMQPGKFVTHKQPKGVALIIAPWNYPIQLTFNPLISAIAAGCAAVIKPSELTPASAKITEEIVNQYLDTDLFRVVQGAVAETTALLKERWNHIFYTGNGAVGRIVAKAAGESLASCTLELGGKSPVYVAEDANVRVAARRIVGTKLFNVGQTCVAPDYVTVHEKVRDPLLAEMKKAVVDFVGEDSQKSESLGRIINHRHFDRISNILKDNHGGKVIHGGLEKADRSDKFIPPTIILDPKLDSALMHEELFAPVLPIVTVKSMDQALDIINSKESSLASYIFTETTETADKFVKFTNSGGSCVNDCLFHIATPDMPFGGHSGGGSGIGSYHGFAGFNEFTHYRGTFTHSTWLDPNNRYPPYKESDVPVLKMLLIGPIIPPHIVTGMKVLAAGAAAAYVFKSKL
jgi:acyl-CoA reductase-like NAD-dependent aldehyde dehydrogenase